MDYYDIISLIVYWVNQEQEDFKALRAIVEVVRDESIEEEEKGDIIFSILRESGLREVSFGSLENEYLELNDQPEIESNLPTFKTEMMLIDILNTKAQVIVHLN
ncbi:MAG: hypothetical protein HWE22_13945 [Flavobacteriales bacterium]|nr:hypothetical protein [Flavobacteriales bacterium]